MRGRVRIQRVHAPGHPLNGQLDVIATDTIRAGTIAPYSGLVLEDSETTKYLMRPRQLAACLHFWYVLLTFFGWIDLPDFLLAEFHWLNLLGWI